MYLFKQVYITIITGNLPYFANKHRLWSQQLSIIKLTVQMSMVKYTVTRTQIILLVW
jgi:hypothetical protein